MVKERLNKKNGHDSSVAVRLGNINKENTICIKLFKSRSTRIKKKK